MDNDTQLKIILCSLLDKAEKEQQMNGVAEELKHLSCILKETSGVFKSLIELTRFIDNSIDSVCEGEPIKNVLKQFKNKIENFYLSVIKFDAESADVLDKFDCSYLEKIDESSFKQARQLISDYAIIRKDSKSLNQLFKEYIAEERDNLAEIVKVASKAYEIEVPEPFNTIADNESLQTKERLACLEEYVNNRCRGEYLFVTKFGYTHTNPAEDAAQIFEQVYSANLLSMVQRLAVVLDGLADKDKNPLLEQTLSIAYTNCVLKRIQEDIEKAFETKKMLYQRNLEKVADI